MKKFIKIILIILIIGLLVGGGIFALFHFGIIQVSKPIEEPTIRLMKDEYGKLYTVDEWKWKPIETKEKISYIPDCSYVSTMDVVLHLEDNKYVSMNIKDSEYYSDNMKTIYARDGSYIIQVSSGCTFENLANFAGIQKPQVDDVGIMTSIAEVQGAYVIATVVEEDIAVIAKIYNDSEVYSTILNSYRNGLDVFEVRIPNEIEEPKVLSIIPESDLYLPTATPDYAELTFYSYHYADGSLYVQNKVDSLKSLRDSYKIKLNVLSGSAINTYYSDKKIYYAEAGECTLGLLSISTNSTIVMIGNGEEARANIQYLLNSYD